MSPPIKKQRYDKARKKTSHLRLHIVRGVRDNIQRLRYQSAEDISLLRQNRTDRDFTEHRQFHLQTMRTFSKIKQWLRDYIKEHSNEEIFFTAWAIICLAFLIVAIIICIIKINQL